MLMPNEQVVKVVWPSITAWPLGRWVGRVWGWALARGPLAALCAGFFLAPVAALVYLWRLRPRRCRRYLVTSERLLLVEGLIARVVWDAPWSQISRLEVVTHPGQVALQAGDVQVYEGDRMLFTLPGVSLVENFIRICHRTQQAKLQVSQLRERRRA